jgi:hypothetical protein
VCSDESLLQEDNSLSAELGSLHLRDASGKTIGSSRLLDIQGHEIASSNPSSMNHRYYSMMRNWHFFATLRLPPTFFSLYNLNMLCLLDQRVDETRILLREKLNLEEVKYLSLYRDC